MRLNESMIRTYSGGGGAALVGLAHSNGGLGVRLEVQHKYSTPSERRDRARVGLRSGSEDLEWVNQPLRPMDQRLGVSLLAEEE